MRPMLRALGLGKLEGLWVGQPVFEQFEANPNETFILEACILWRSTRLDMSVYEHARASAEKSVGAFAFVG